MKTSQSNSTTSVRLPKNLTGNNIQAPSSHRERKRGRRPGQGRFTTNTHLLELIKEMQHKFNEDTINR